MKIGAIVSQTGAGTPYGHSQLEGLQLAIRQLNESKAVPAVR